MKQDTIITELFADIEKFGWDLVKDKKHFYIKVENTMLNLAYLKGKLDNNRNTGDFEQYYNETYGEEESN